MTIWRDDILRRYETEPALTALITAIATQKTSFEKDVSGLTARGHPYGFGGMPFRASARLYGLVREFKPETLVETGVCNGVSTAVILAALHCNRAGSLYSIDLPEHSDTHYEPGAFWEGKKGAVVPKGRQPGWLVPAGLRSRWHLTIGRAQEALPPLLRDLGSIDFFLHDSEHSYECMTFEYRESWRYLGEGGLLVSDDADWNSAFDDFCRSQSREVRVLDRGLRFAVK